MFAPNLEASREAEEVVIRLSGGQFCGGGRGEERRGLSEEGAAWRAGGVPPPTGRPWGLLAKSAPRMPSRVWLVVVTAKKLKNLQGGAI